MSFDSPETVSMARKSSTPVIIAVVIFVVLAVLIRFFGSDLMASLRRIHGGGD
jgi:hypothetical protein